jgi:DNA-directed RNA polymerase
MDSAHLSESVMSMANQGLYITVIHDSFGCLAANTDIMLAKVAEEWTALYTEDNLAKLH